MQTIVYVCVCVITAMKWNPVIQTVFSLVQSKRNEEKSFCDNKHVLSHVTLNILLLFNSYILDRLHFFCWTGLAGWLASQMINIRWVGYFVLFLSLSLSLLCKNNREKRKVYLFSDYMKIKHVTFKNTHEYVWYVCVCVCANNTYIH